MEKPIVVTTAMSSYGRTARMALEEKGVEYEVEQIEFDTVASEEYRKHHPFNKVPAFYHGDLHLFETAAIARYVDEAFDGPALQPKDHASRAVMEMCIGVSDNYAYPIMISRLVWQRLVIPMQGGTPDEAVIAESITEVGRQLRLINDQLKGHDFLVGDQLSLADLFLGPIVFYVGMTPEGGKMIDELENVKAWQTRFTARPSWQATS